ncbi:MAG: tetratricopeptide repeat protein [Kiritimatiellaeota bacterium]|nr:tetratricopeptide repeat protein [Kiritimatiellota bacterium]
MKRSRQTGTVALAMALMAGAVFGQAAKVTGTIIRTNTTEAKGDLQWKTREKAYTVTANNITVEIPFADVAEVNVPRPKVLDDLEKLVREKNASQAVAGLEKLVADYLMLTWDRPATRLLATAYLQMDDVDKAIRVCENIIKVDPDSAYLGEFAPVYWQALQKKGNNSKVEDLMAKAIKSGDRLASAFALIMRGDMILATGDTSDNAKKALRDGYLRVVALYNSVGERAARPEALYKAAKCFEKSGQLQRAESFRTELKKDFAGTEWAVKP